MTTARRALGQISTYVIGIRVARTPSVGSEAGGALVNALDDIVDRAIDYTNLILRRAPSYREAAISGLRTLRESLAEKAPDDPAIQKLEAFLNALSEGASNKSI
jgi:flagellar hook-associated protein FlgK